MRNRFHIEMLIELFLLKKIVYINLIMVYPLQIAWFNYLSERQKNGFIHFFSFRNGWPKQSK